MQLDHDYLKHFQLKENSVIIDLGATNGEFMYIYKDELLKNNCFVVNVEPVTEQFINTSVWALMNMPNNSITLSTGVWNKNTCLTLSVTDNVWCNTFKEHEHEEAKSATHYTRIRENKAPVLTLDTIIEVAGGKIDLIKADIEGAEIEVFESCTKLDQVNNFAIAAYHIVDGEKTIFRLKKFFEEKGFETIHECEPYNGFPPYDILYVKNIKNEK